MTSMNRPAFMDSPFFVPEMDNWHLLPGAPEEVVKEFEEWTRAYEESPVGKMAKGSIPEDDDELLIVT